MTIEADPTSASVFIDDLNATYPAGIDAKSEGDNHMRLIKKVLKNTFPSIDGALSATDTELNYVSGVTSALQTQLNAKAPLASPTFTGTVTLPADALLGEDTIQSLLDAKEPALAYTLVQTADSPVTAAAGTNYLADPDSDALVINLPAGTAGDVIRVKVSHNASAAQYVRLTPDGSEVIAGQTGGDTLDIDAPFVELTLVYNATLGWAI